MIIKAEDAFVQVFYGFYLISTTLLSQREKKYRSMLHARKLYIAACIT